MAQRGPRARPGTNPTTRGLTFALVPWARWGGRGDWDKQMFFGPSPPVLARIQAVVGEGPVQLGCRGGVGRVSLRHLCGMTRHVWRLNSRPVSSLGCRSTSSERPRLGRRAPAPVASGVSAIARCTECGPARWWCNSTAPRREDAASWCLCRGLAPSARFVRYCVAVSTLEGDLVLDPGRLHHARSP